MDDLHGLRSATERFAMFLGKADHDAPVASCPGWTVRDLVVHVGTVHRWAASIVLSGQRVAAPVPVVTEPLGEWYERTAGALAAALAAVAADEPTPNFSRIGERAAFWLRRQVHETTVHAVDLAQVARLHEDEWGITPAVAADGVEEVLGVYFPRLTARGERPHVQARVRFTATDVDRSWIIAPAGDGMDTPVLVHASQGADAEIRGTANDLYLGLWHRVPTDRLQVVGTAAAVLLAGPTSS